LRRTAGHVFASDFAVFNSVLRRLQRCHQRALRDRLGVAPNLPWCSSTGNVSATSKGAGQRCLPARLKRLYIQVKIADSYPAGNFMIRPGSCGESPKMSYPSRSEFIPSYSITGPVGSLSIMGSNLFPTPRLIGDSTHAAPLCFFSDSSVRSRAFMLSLRYTRSEWNITTPLLWREYSAKSRWLSSPSRAFAYLSRESILGFVQSVPESRTENYFFGLARSFRS
jgi:hypothetical protein